MTAQEREALRHLIDQRRRADLQLQVGKCPETGLSMRYSYRELGCRCVTCREWSTVTRRGRRRGVVSDGLSRVRIEHGASAYGKRGCRCEICTAANREACRQARERRRARLAA